MNRAIAAALGTALLAAAEDPGRVLVVSQAAANADDGNAATDAAPLRTIGAAMRQVRAGDTVLVRAGVYRERIAPTVGGDAAKPLVVQAAPGERVVVRGSDEVTAWTPLPESPGVFATAVAALAPAETNPFLLALRVSPGEKPGELRQPARPAAERRPATGHDNVIRGNTISDNGISGIAGIGHERSLVADNLVERNGWLDLDESEVAWAEWGGIKLHAAAAVEGNLVRDNEGFGIWMDNIRGGRVTRNVVVNNKGVGIFAELGAGDIRIDSNLVAMTRWAAPFYDGTGIYAHDISGLTVAHNLVVGNAGAGVEARVVSGRTIDGRPVAADGTAVLNNIILGNARTAISLPAADPRAQGLRSDGNLLAGNREYHQGRDRGWPELCAVNRFALGFAYAEVQAKADAVRAAGGQSPLPAGWPRNPALDLATWQGALGLDLHSREEPNALRVHVRARIPAVRLDHDGSLAGFRCPPVPGVDRDLTGAPMPDGEVRPGPFQELPQGRSEIVLPLPGVRP